MPKKIKIYEKGLEEHPTGQIIVGNLAMLLIVALGTIACFYIYVPLALIYPIFSLLMIYVVLRKIVCTNCYYYNKKCPIGWGKLAALLFKQGKIENFNKSIGLKIAPLFYSLMMIVPIILIIISIYWLFSWIKIIILILLFLLMIYSGSISRKMSCSNCKMRLICPGSAVK